MEETTQGTTEQAQQEPITATKAKGRTRPVTVAASNPFDDVFGRILFSDLKKIEPMKPFDDGTVQTRLTEVAVELGNNTNVYLQGAFIVKREQGDSVVVRLQLPTGATRFQKLINLTEASASVVNHYDSWERDLINKWRAYRKKQTAAGNVQVVASTGHQIAKDELKDLGF